MSPRPKKPLSAAKLSALKKAQEGRSRAAKARREAKEAEGQKPAAEPAKAAIDENRAGLQQAIDKFAEAGDGIPVPGDGMTDRSTALRGQQKLDAIDKEALGADGFAQTYDEAVEAQVGYLKRFNSSGDGRTAMVPPNARRHPKLGIWCYLHHGKYLVLRWIAMYPTTQQKRQAQGFIYFKGKDWCDRLGLLPGVYLDEKSRIKWHDTYLGWCSEEFVIERTRQASEKSQAMLARAEENVNKFAGTAGIHAIQVLHGTDDEVTAELRERKQFAEARA